MATNTSRPTPVQAGGTHGAGHDDGHDDAHYIVPASVFYKVFAALICLTIVTVGVSRIDLGFFNDIAAFGIATVKAGLVLSVFMHLKYDDMLNRVIIGCAFFFLLVLYFFTELDQVTRIVSHSGL